MYFLENFVNIDRFSVGRSSGNVQLAVFYANKPPETNLSSDSCISQCHFI